MKFILFPFLAFLFAQFSSAQIYVTPEDWDNRHIHHFPDRRPVVKKMYTIDAVEVDATVKDQIAEVSVTQTVRNPNDYGMEVQVLFPLPGDGVIQNFILMVDGEEITGELLSKEKARSIYEGIVRSKRDPALMEYMGYGLFKTSIFPVGVGQSRKISIRYTQVIEKRLGNMQFVYPIGTLKFSSRPIPKVTVNARIRTTKDIKSVYSPTGGVVINKSSERLATVKYEGINVQPSTDFKFNYGLDDGTVGASLYSHKSKINEKGYFMFVASPKVEVKETVKVPKNIIFVLDQSGSMSGKKIEQSKSALEFVLSNLNKEDNFKIITYNDRVENYKKGFEAYNQANYKEASAYVKSIGSGGGTNIEGALKEALSGLKTDRPNYLIFLTDGKATAGITDEHTIAQNVEKYNTTNTRIFCFGVGNNVNARLLDKLSTNNGGMAEYVKPNEDVEIAVSNLYQHISNPVMTGIEVVFKGVQVRETYPVRMPDLFQGSQLVIHGTYSKSGKGTVVMTGKINGEPKTFEFPVEFASPSGSGEHQYAEKLWAGKRIAYLLTMIDQNGKDEEMVKELVDLSKKYGILTPYTSFLAREDVDVTSTTSIRERSTENLKMLDATSGSSANAVRKYKNNLSKVAETEDAVYAYDNEGVKTEVKSIKKLDNKTFYFKDNAWVDGDINEKLEGANEIEKFSKSYFDFIDKHKNVSNYLSLDGDIYLEVEGEIYLFNEKSK